MLRHILTTFLRFAATSRFQLTTIVLGLTIGIVISVLIYVYVREESSFDEHHVNSERIYRVNTTLELEGKVDHTAKAGLNLGEALMEFYPEVEDFTQMLNIGKQTIKVGTELFASEQVVYADSNFFSFFTYPFIEGQLQDALMGPNKAVISESTANQYFGSASKAIGNTMNVNKVDFQVTGVYRDVKRTHIPYKIFLSLSTLPPPFLQQRNREFMWLTTFNYIRIKPGTRADELQAKFTLFNEKQLIPYATRNQVNGSLTLALSPVTSIHLDDSLRFDIPGAINPNYLRIFSAVALLTLFIALINYVNLTTAQVSKRLKEIGIKKSIGATRGTLLSQFLLETVILVGVSFLLSMLVLYIAVPELNRLTERTFTFFEIVDSTFAYRAVAFIILFGLMAGIYPALLLSSFRPIQALQSSQKVTAGSWFQRVITPGSVRKVLVTIQFTISIFLIIGTIFIFDQFTFMKTRGMGFNQDQVMVIDIPSDTAVANHMEAVKQSIRDLAAVKSVSATSSIPGTPFASPTLNVSQSGGSEIKVVNSCFTDEKFIEALDVQLVSGRFFSRDFSTDPQQSFVINEAAAKFLGWDSPIGKKIVSPFGQNGEVVGVVKDFNYKSLHSTIEPLVIMNILNSQGYLLIKMSTTDVHETVEQIGELWKAFDDAHPYEYFFLDEKFQSQYAREERLASIFTWFSGFAILISCLGLMGLAIFTNELKTKEIAIRKTMGATQFQLFRLLSREFLLLILLANLVAWPLSYFMVVGWLSEFAYQTTMGPTPFLAGTFIAVAIALSTISYFAARAAGLDIVKALKHE